MTSSMGQKRWKDTWSEGTGGRGRRRSRSSNIEVTAMPLAGTSASRRGQGVGAESEASSLGDYGSPERPATRDTGAGSLFLNREQSTLSSHVDSTNYQEKLQGWSALFHHDHPIPAQRPGTSINSTRPLSISDEIDREISFLTTNRTAFPMKPRELHDPLDGVMPSSRLVAQRKYYVLPSIGNDLHDLVLRRQRSNMETTTTPTCNQLDYTRENYEDDAEFFAELIEVKRSEAAGTPRPQRCASTTNPLPPIAKLRDRVRPRTNIAELDEDHFAFSGRMSPAGLSDSSDIEDLRGKTPDPEYADSSPRKSEPSLMPSSRRHSVSVLPGAGSPNDVVVGPAERMEDAVPLLLATGSR